MPVKRARSGSAEAPESSKKAKPGKTLDYGPYNNLHNRKPPARRRPGSVGNDITGKPLYPGQVVTTHSPVARADPNHPIREHSRDLRVVNQASNDQGRSMVYAPLKASSPWAPPLQSWGQRPLPEVYDSHQLAGSISRQAVGVIEKHWRNAKRRERALQGLTFQGQPRSGGQKARDQIKSLPAVKESYLAQLKTASKWKEDVLNDARQFLLDAVRLRQEEESRGIPLSPFESDPMPGHIYGRTHGQDEDQAERDGVPMDSSILYTPVRVRKMVHSARGRVQDLQRKIQSVAYRPQSNEGQRLIPKVHPALVMRMQLGEQARVRRPKRKATRAKKKATAAVF